MWIFLNDAFISAVQHRDDPNMLVVRARFDQDLRRVFPNADINYSDDTDYPCRVFVTKDQFIEVMTSRMQNINYPNFKDSCISKGRAKVYMDIWYVMAMAQYRKLLGRKD